MKQLIKDTKYQIQQLKQTLSDMGERVVQGYDALEVNKASLEHKLTTLEQLKKQLDVHVSVPTDVVDQLQAELDLQDQQRQVLLEKVKAAQQRCQEKQQRQQELQAHVDTLEQRLPVAQQLANEAFSLSQAKDPQVEELGQW